MRIPRIYHSTNLADAFSSGTLVALDPEAAGHIGRVLRMQPDQEIILFDGTGGEYNATIINASKKNVGVQLNDFNDRSCESPLSIHLGQGISRGDKMDFTIQKIVELGVTEVTPLFTERCGVKLSGERLEKKWQQWQKIMASACEQCGRNTVPVVHKPISLDLWLQQPSNELKINLHPRANDSIKTLSPPQNGIRLLIGPEGGLSDKEIDTTVTAGFTEIVLGPRILRTETAGLTVVAALQLQFGDLA
ncbi:MAG: 16S rRNA (uracil1498-N3)-methyltransferase [Phenylobacterium sp.]|jgi:16S rRNA (uracil1498-N3)-methyltransferase